MKKKTIIYLLIVFVLFLIFSGYPWIKEKLGIGQQRISELELTQIQEDQTDLITFKSTDQEITLIKTNGMWKINEYDVSFAEIKDFFALLKDLDVAELISKNSANHEKLGVSNVKGYEVVFHNADEQKGFIFSEKGSAADNFYVRKNNDDKVYLVKSLLPEQIKYLVNDWRNKSIVFIKQEDIQRIEIHKSGEMYQVKQDQGKFIIEGKNLSKDLSEESTSLMTTYLNNFQASGFLNDEQRKELDDFKDKIVIKIYNFSKEVLLETYIVEKENEYWAKVVGQEDYYVLSKYSMPEFLIKPEVLFE